MESLLFGFPIASASRTSALPADLQTSLAKYRQRESRFTSTLTRPVGLDEDGEQGSVFQKRLNIERTVFSLFDRPDSLRLAGQFAAQIELAYEWEGMADGPLGEAASADAFLASHRDSPIAPYVHLFSGHRKLCAVSDYTGADRTTTESRQITREANHKLQLARAAGHQLIRVVADYLLNTRKCVER